MTDLLTSVLAVLMSLLALPFLLTGAVMYTLVRLGDA